MHGVPQSDAISNDHRDEDDIGVITAMMNELESDEVKVTKLIRLGKKAARTNEGGWGAIFIHQDLTPKQRETRKLLLQEMKERTTRGEKDLMIFNGKIIKKTPRAENN